MSSTIEGSDDWAREDELDLGQEDEAPAPNGLDHGSLRTDDDPLGYDGEESSLLPSQDSPGPTKHAVANDSPPPQPQKVAGMGAPLGSPDETASTPDDTPSLHVGNSGAVWYIC